MSTEPPQPTTESSLLHFIDHLCPLAPAIIEPPQPVTESIEPPATQEEQPTIPLPMIVPVTRAQLPPVTWHPTDHRKQRSLRDALITLGIQAICIVFFVFQGRPKD